MKAQQVKITIVALCVATLGWIAWSFYDFLKNKNTYLTAKSPRAIGDELSKEGSGKAAKTIQRRPLDDFKVLHDLNITGKEKGIDPGKGLDLPALPKGLRDALRVLYIQADLDAPGQGRGYVLYLDPALQLGVKESYLTVGAHLPGNYAKVFLEAVLPDRLVFKWEDEDKREEVKIQEYDLIRGLMGFMAGLDGGGGIRTAVPGFNYPADYSPPQETRQISEGEYWIGTKDVDKFEKSYQTVLRDVQVSSYYDPKLKRHTGIRVDSIGPGSVAYSYGVQSGDIIKSINGNPVSSKEQAINWVKAHPDLPRYDVVIERQGKELTKTYIPPPKKK